MTVNVGDLVAVRVMQILPGKIRIQWAGKTAPEWVWLPVEAVVEIAKLEAEEQEGG